MIGPTFAERVGIHRRARIAGVPVGPRRLDWVQVARVGTAVGAAAVGLRRALGASRSDDGSDATSAVDAAKGAIEGAGSRLGTAAQDAADDLGSRLQDMFPPPRSESERSEPAPRSGQASTQAATQTSTRASSDAGRGSSSAVDEQESVLLALEALEHETGCPLGEVLWIGRPLSAEHGDAQGWMGTVTLLEPGDGGLETAQPAAYLIAAGDDGSLHASRRLGRY